MTINEKLFAYICPSCAGHLVLDSAKANFICNSCGNTYDYDYFMGEDLLKKGTDILRKKEYNAAYDMFEFLLKKEPDNTPALLGKLLAEMKVNAVSSLTVESFQDLSEDIDFDSYISLSDDAHMKVFTGLKECSEIGKNFNSRDHEIVEAKEKISMLNKEISSLGYKERQYYFTSIKNPEKTFSPKEALVINFMVGGFWAFVFFLLAIQGNEMVPGIISLIFVAIMIVIFFLVRPRINAIKAIETEIRKKQVEVRQTENITKSVEDFKAVNRSTIANKIRDIKRAAANM